MNSQSDDVEDVHLCIKCHATIVGLRKYIYHRKQNCLRIGGGSRKEKPLEATATTSATTEHVTRTVIARPSLEHSYDGFNFAEAEAPSSYLRKTTASHGGKTSKGLAEAYEPTYELGADVFFSSLQLQSVSTGGKTGARPERVAKEEQSWHSAGRCSDPLLKAVREHEEPVFKSLNFAHSPEASEEEDDEEEPDESDGDDDEADNDQDPDYDPELHPDEDYDGRRHSPPTVPATHTGGKWRPEQRPQLHHTHLERISPSWDEPAEDAHDHPPAEHTHGKWVPGSKQLEYRENIDLTKLKQPSASYWCNICCRRLKTRLIYDQHLRSNYHKRRADTECQLEQANLQSAHLKVNKNFAHPPAPSAKEQVHQRRRRRARLLRCELCRHSMARHLMGKHLISHYHYRRMQLKSQVGGQSASLHAILEHMGSIVRQAPFQCLPCRFYANTEQAFQVHWRSSEHIELTGRLGGTFWCSYCQFECASNEEMWQHLLGNGHMEVLHAINRSVPVCIGQRRHLNCSVCQAKFLYNAQLRRHFASEHMGVPPTGSASDDYQCRFRCDHCGAPQKSRVALQRHEKHKHRLSKYYCAVCELEFETPLAARRHRSLLSHKQNAMLRQDGGPCSSSAQPEGETEIEHMLREVLDDPLSEPEQPTTSSGTGRRRVSISQCANCQQSFESAQALIQHRSEAHPMENHCCLSCGSSFQTAQALGRHTRTCQPITSISSTMDAVANYWPCDQCGFSAQYESDLLYHRFFHIRGPTIGKDELLQCPRCPKRFRKHSLRAHLRNHTNERIFECEQCKAKFARRHNLKSHMDNIHGQRENPEKAPRTTTTTTTTTTAMRTKPKFECGTCGKMLAKNQTEQNIARHFNKSELPNDDDDDDDDDGNGDDTNFRLMLMLMLAKYPHRT
ncbi:hypothetical protein AWZ03_010619 [Drosophila navojoa]|uniref:C2H2-type domain-containing protein n=1 Tax=Drosophila navojoa TaxID=7232 RepID=A0A484B4D9_DRONA|nr:zinc finger protein 629 [Drosophila navojoa]TDG42950.1 hypothetical protein AWZ03_010619 [Drosophila navojoa]